ncbi:plasmid mobilization protein [Sulfitobacter pontiacus]|uniref:plasmid mobilization protein n=1 Tax=Sulfitobacter pontiacus TaxID=60137 RepID=UPI0030EF0E09
MTREQYQRDYRQQYRDHAKRVNLTFSLAEYRGIARSAKDAGSPVAAYVKRLALQAHEGRSVAPEEIAKQLADLERVIRTIANNVNQMARHSNRIAHVLDEQEVFLHIASLQTELRETISRAASGQGSAQAPEDEGDP